MVGEEWEWLTVIRHNSPRSETEKEQRAQDRDPTHRHANHDAYAEDIDAHRVDDTGCGEGHAAARMKKPARSQPGIIYYLIATLTFQQVEAPLEV